MNHSRKCVALAAAISVVAPAYAGHWELVSFNDSSYSTSDATYVTRSARQSHNLTMPAGSIYGVGPFPFYGEKTTYSKTVSTGNPGLQYFAEWARADYTFVYKWIRDAPSDTAPGVPVTENNTIGYSIERAKDVDVVRQNPVGLDTYSCGIWSWSALFNSQGKTWNGTSIPPDYVGKPENWPQAADTPNLFIGSDRYYARPVVVGGGITSYDANGDIIFTMTVMNMTDVILSTPISCSNPLITLIACRNKAEMFCYKGAAQILNDPVEL